MTFYINVSFCMIRGFHVDIKCVLGRNAVCLYEQCSTNYFWTYINDQLKIPSRCSDVTCNFIEQNYINAQLWLRKCAVKAECVDATVSSMQLNKWEFDTNTETGTILFFLFISFSLLILFYANLTFLMPVSSLIPFFYQVACFTHVMMKKLDFP